MKRYQLFIGDNYYPSGGLGDYIGAFEYEESAEICMQDYKTSDWAEIARVSDSGKIESMSHWRYIGTKENRYLDAIWRKM